MHYSDAGKCLGNPGAIQPEKTKLTYFAAGLAVGLLAWVVGDRVFAHLRAQRYQEAMKNYELTEFLEDKPEYVHGDLLRLELTDLKGNTSTLGELARGHRTLFVNFWATWCSPCIDEMPSIERLEEMMGDEVAFFILTYEPTSVLKPFADKHGWTLPVFSYDDETLLPGALAEDGVPRTYLIHDEKLELDHLGAAPWDGDKAVSFIKKLLTADSVD